MRRKGCRLLFVITFFLTFPWVTCGSQPKGIHHEPLPARQAGRCPRPWLCLVFVIVVLEALDSSINFAEKLVFIDIFFIFFDS